MTRPSLRLHRTNSAPRGRRKLSSKDAKAIKDRLRGWLSRAEETQAESADRIGVSHSSVKRWLAPDRGIGVASLVRLARAERISLDWLLLGHGPESIDASRPAAALTQEIEIAVAQRIAQATGVSIQFATSIVADHGGERIISAGVERLTDQVVAEAALARAAHRRARLFKGPITRVGNRLTAGPVDLDILREIGQEAHDRILADALADARRLKRPDPDAR